MKTVPAAETQNSQAKIKIYCVPPADIMHSEVQEGADGREGELKANNKNHFQNHTFRFFTTHQKGWREQNTLGLVICLLSLFVP